MKCLFCDVISGKIPAHKVWENQDFLIILDINPINRGHLLVLPKEHLEDIFEDMPKKMFTNIFLLTKAIAPTLKKITKAKRIGLAIEGFGVPHIHIHLVPVNKGNELNPLRAKKVSSSSLVKLQKKMSKSFYSLL